MNYSDDIYNLDDVINYHISKYRNNNYTKAELYQIAYLGYLKARDAYNPEKGGMTLLYVSKYIKGELWHTLSKENKIKQNEIPFEDKNNYEYKTDYINILSNEEQTEDLNIKNKLGKHVEKIKSILHLIPQEEADIIYDYYLASRPKSLLELAIPKGLTKQRIHQIKEQGILHIKEILGVDYLSKGI